MLLIYKEIKVFFYHIILFIWLAVYLRLEYSEKFFFVAKKETKQELELEIKNRCAITNNKVEKTMVLHNYIDNHVHNC